VVGASVALVISVTPVVGFLPLIALSDANEKSSGGALLFLTLITAAVVAFLQLLAIATRELTQAEGNNFRWLLQRATSLALFFWPIGFFWIQVRVRRLVKEFDTGEYSKLPMEAVRFSDDVVGEAIPLTRRVPRRHAKSYAEELIRRAGGSNIRERRSAGGMSWEFKAEGSPYSLVFSNEPPLFTLHSSASPEEEGLFKLWWRLKESN
jgi:hypothetical protein